ncbi:hypothetical protein GGI07_002410 [Coemansia sp. Benny D115]|nr:hypothetical protein GGI07_002410 [Coemansia sp. Benny D115]
MDVDTPEHTTVEQVQNQSRMEDVFTPPNSNTHTPQRASSSGPSNVLFNNPPRAVDSAGPESPAVGSAGYDMASRVVEVEQIRRAMNDGPFRGSGGSFRMDSHGDSNEDVEKVVHKDFFNRFGNEWNKLT